jgi:isocitrate/isopropylmalate dehydrogenase
VSAPLIGLGENPHARMLVELVGPNGAGRIQSVLDSMVSRADGSYDFGHLSRTRLIVRQLFGQTPSVVEANRVVEASMSINESPSYRVCVIPGDDSAPEAMAASLRVLEAMGLPIEWDHVAPGSELAALSMAERESIVHTAIDRCDTTLFGASSGITPGAIMMRWGKQTFANVRPVQWRPGLRTPLRDPSGIDYVIVRENLEDMYVGVMGDASELLDAGLASPRSRIPADVSDARYAAKLISRAGTEQVARFACDLAMSRSRKLTVSAKTNMLPATDRFFCDIAREIAQEYPGLEYEQFIVDDMAHRLVLAPHGLDVLLLPNLYGDILSDEGAATIGGMGLAPSGCYGHGAAYFESAHGTAPDLIGLGVINPTATLLSAVMMLRHLGLDDGASRLDDAVTHVYGEGRTLPTDQGGEAGTEQFADAVIATLSD